MNIFGHVIDKKNYIFASIISNRALINSSQLTLITIHWGSLSRLSRRPFFFFWTSKADDPDIGIINNKPPSKGSLWAILNGTSTDVKRNKITKV